MPNNPEVQFNESNKMDKVFYYSLILYAFSLPLSRTAVSIFSILLPIIWVINLLLNKPAKSNTNTYPLYYLALIPLIYIISLLWTDNFLNGINQIRIFFYWLMIPVIISTVNRTKVKALISSFIYGTSFSCLISYLIMFGLLKYGNATPENPSPFMTDIEYSIFLALCAILLTQKIITNIKDLQNRPLTINTINLIFIIMILFSIEGRTGQVALFLTIPSLAIVNSKFKLRALISSLVLGSLIFLAAFQTNSTFEKNFVVAAQDFNKSLKEGNYTGSLGLRIGAWAVAFEVIKDKPLLGSGVGDYMDDFKTAINELPRYKASNWFPHLHNQYIQTTMQTGLIGLIICLIYLVKYFKLQIKDLETKSLQLTFASIYLFSCFMEPLWIKQFSTALFALFNGIIIASSEPLIKLKTDEKTPKICR